MGTRQGIVGTVALIVFVLAGAVVLAAGLGIFPTHDPDFQKSAPTTPTTVPTCAAQPTPSTTAGICVRPDGVYEIVP